MDASDFLRSCFPTASAGVISQAVLQFPTDIDAAVAYLLKNDVDKKPPDDLEPQNEVDDDDEISDDELIEALKKIHQYETDALLAHELETQLQTPSASTKDQDDRMTQLLSMFESAHDDPRLLAFIHKTSRQQKSLNECIELVFDYISKTTRKSKKKILLFQSSESLPNYTSPSPLSSSTTSSVAHATIYKKSIESSLSYLPPNSTSRYNQFLTLSPSTTYLDLHHLTLAAALHILSVHLPKWYTFQMDSNGGDKKRMDPCYVVTGVGKHTDGKPVLYKQIGTWLVRNMWKYVEGDGSYLVLGKRKLK